MPTARNGRRLEPGVHLVLLGRQALVEAVAGEVAGRDRVRPAYAGLAGGARDRPSASASASDEGADGVGPVRG